MSACDLIVSVAAETLESLHERAAVSATDADLVELRLDGLAPGQRDPQAVASATRAIAERIERPWQRRPRARGATRAS
ncbi:MAG: type I 3-dehydroquinate dehydratase, partial [Planctomycetota bacterium]